MLKVFVYGTLRRGETNHRWMKGARYLGEYRTLPRYRLIDAGPYPVLVSGGRTAIHGEVYAISRLILSRLDVLEAYPVEYQRTLIATPWGRAWGYLRHRLPPGRQLYHGDWLQRDRFTTSFSWAWEQSKEKQ